MQLRASAMHCYQGIISFFKDTAQVNLLINSAVSNYLFWVMKSQSFLKSMKVASDNTAGPKSIKVYFKLIIFKLKKYFAEKVRVWKADLDQQIRHRLQKKLWES